MTMFSSGPYAWGRYKTYAEMHAARVEDGRRFLEDIVRPAEAQREAERIARYLEAAERGA